MNQFYSFQMATAIFTVSFLITFCISNILPIGTTVAAGLFVGIVFITSLLLVRYKGATV